MQKKTIEAPTSEESNRAKDEKLPEPTAPRRASFVEVIPLRLSGG